MLSWRLKVSGLARDKGVGSSRPVASSDSVGRIVDAADGAEWLELVDLVDLADLADPEGDEWGRFCKGVGDAIVE